MRKNVEVVSEEYVQGFEDCMALIRKNTGVSMKKHNDARSLKDLVAVMNDLIEFLHRQEQAIRDFHDQSEDIDKDKIEIIVMKEGF